MSKLLRTALATAMSAAILQSMVAANAQDIIKVGAPLPLTGPLSPEGTKQQRGNNLWAETVNSKGGI